MKIAARIGLQPSEFWEMTPKELNIYASAYSERKQDEAEEQKQLAYFTAVLTACFVWKKKLPSYKEVCGNKPKQESKSKKIKKTEPMSAEAMLEEFKKIQAAAGWGVY